MAAAARTSPALSQEATRRLLRDWKEVQKEPIHTVVAKPLEDNLSEWHCNMIPDEGPYKGTAFHLVLQFPTDYPNSPPKVRLCTHLQHPNVFGEWICLDMIKEPEYYSRPYQGWSTAYSVQSVLLQLQSFLFAENVDQDYGGPYKNKANKNPVGRAKRAAAAFHCRGCGFSGSASAVPPNRHPVNWDHHGGYSRGRTWQWESRPVARAPEHTVNDVIAQALDRRTRSRGAAAAAASDAASDAGSDAVRVVPVEELESATRSPASDQDTSSADMVTLAKTSVESGAKAVSPPAQSVESPPKTARKIIVTPSRKMIVTPLNSRDNPVQAEPEPASAKEVVLTPVNKAPAEKPQTLGTPQNLPDRLSALPADVLVQIMDQLDAPGLSALVRASKHFVRASTERGAWVRRELQCFHSKRGFTEEVLGFGLGTKGLEEPDRVRYFAGHCGDATCSVCGPLPRQERASKPGKGKWEGALSMDYLSAGAFFEGKVRRGVWNERLDWWLPLLLDDEHSARALPLLKGTISALAENPRKPPSSAAAVQYQKFYPLDTLKVLPRLMNSMVVSFMKQKGTGANVDLHASEKALLGYCQLHHMLLRLAQEYPVIQAAIDRALSRFQNTPSTRNKTETPDLGELLVLLSAAKTGGVTWASLAPAFMGETLDRNVLWLLRDHPELALLEANDSISDYRLTTTFDASATSRRLIMFQVAFLLLVRPSGSSVSETLAEYSQRYGYPRPGLTRKLQEIWYRVIKVATWPSYYSQLGLKCPPKLALCEMLRQAVVSSRRKGYHSAERLRLGDNKALLGKRRVVEPTVRTGGYKMEERTGPRTGVPAGGRTGNGSVPVSSGGYTAPSTSAWRSNKAPTGRDQRTAARQVALVSENPFSVLATVDDE